MTSPSDVVRFFADLLPAYRSGERDGLLAAIDALADQLLAQRKAGIAAGPEDPRDFFPAYAASVLHKLLRASFAAGIAGDDVAAQEGFSLADEAGRHAGEWESATASGRELDADLAMAALILLDGSLGGAD